MTIFSEKASPIRVLFESYSCSMRLYFVFTSCLLIIQMLKFKLSRYMKHHDFRKTQVLRDYYECTMMVLR